MKKYIVRLDVGERCRLQHWYVWATPPHIASGKRWKAAEDAQPLDTCTLLTTTPNEVMRPIHNRMPVILRPEDYGRWLDPQNSPAELLPLLRPYVNEELEAYPVGRQVNRPAHDGPDCIRPMLERGDLPAAES